MSERKRADLPMIKGTVLYLEYGPISDVPCLVLEQAVEPMQEILRIPINGPDALKALRRNIASGDCIAISVETVGDSEIQITGFHILSRHQPTAGSVRTLRIESSSKTLQFLNDDFDEPTDLTEFLGDLAHLGEDVFSRTWDGGGINNGVETVRKTAGVYIVENDSGDFGPFRTLMAALAWSEMDHFNTTTESIKCSELDSDALAAILTPFDWNVSSIGYEIEINGEKWQMDTTGALVRAA